MQKNNGDVVIGQVNNIIEDKGVYVTLEGDRFGFVPISQMTTWINSEGKILLKRWQQIKVAVLKDDGNGPILLSQIALERIERLEFESTYEAGTIFEAATITKIETSKVHISLNQYKGVIRKDELNYNVIESFDNIVFVGEVLNVVYLGEDEDLHELQFSRKLLLPKPYDNCLYDLNLNELLGICGLTDRDFIGQAKSYGEYKFIENLYSCGKDKGRLLVDPYYGYNLRALVANNNFDVETDKFYRIQIELIPKDKRLERNQLFQFVAINIEESTNPYKSDVELTFEKYTDPAANTALSKTLEEVGKNMYSSKERMFFELIQNADDAAAQKKVSVNVKTIDDYLIVAHNGYSFDKDDFDSLTSSANGTKKANENKTGYKGIGFKSVFTDSEQVYIKTGLYQFKFDKTYPLFANFEAYYKRVNNLTEEISYKEFLAKYNSEYRRYEGVKSIPWQLKPIWIDKYPKELYSCHFNSNVFIALKIGSIKIAGQDGYESTIDNIIANPKFMLFLRNTKRITFNEKTIAKEIDGNSITLKNSFDTERIAKYTRKDYEIFINNELFEKRGINIRIKIGEIDESSGKVIDAKFVNKDNHEIDNIPKKIAINKSTYISFAVPTSDTGILPNIKREGISLFAFLPTLVKDFRFPFYINANFILDSPRQRILGDNPWNFYLMQEVALKIVEWSAELSNKNDRNALNILLDAYFDEITSTDTNALAHFFNESYKKALTEVAFIRNQSGNLVKQKSIILDKTGSKAKPSLSQIIGSDLFCKVLNSEKKLPSDDIDFSILNNSIFEIVERIKVDDVKESLVDNEYVYNWYISAGEDVKTQFNNWLIENSCNKVINTLPLFNFSSGWKTLNDINQESDIIVMKEKFIPLQNILRKLGFIVSESTIDDCCFKDYIELKDDKDLFDEIVAKTRLYKLTSNEKLLLIKTDFSGVGEQKIKSIKLFNNTNGIATPLESMLVYRDSAPDYLRPYMIQKEECSEEIAKYLINNDDEFEKVVWENIDTFNVSFEELYLQYQPDSLYIRKYIDHSKDLPALLSIVESSDNITKRYYLNKIDRIDLSAGQRYGKTSFEFRVLQLVIGIFETPSDFSNKIFYEKQCITQYTVKDEVSCEYIHKGIKRAAKMSLANLLPEYQNQSDVIERIKGAFESKKDLDKFFDAKRKPEDEIYSELNQTLGVIHATYAPWVTGGGSAQQFLFSVYKRRKSWTEVKGLTIDLSKESEHFVCEMLDFLMENEIDIATSPFTEKIKTYFCAKYLNSKYIFDSEQLLPSIEHWADNEDKRKYLLSNGIRDDNHLAIIFRKAFLDNKSFELNQLDDLDAIASIKFLSFAEGIERPFILENQVKLLETLAKRKNINIIKKIDIDKLKENSCEWTSDEYLKWRQEHYPAIFNYKEKMPWKVIYDNSYLSDSSAEDFYYDKINKAIYVNEECDSQKLLLKIVGEGKCDLDLSDYQQLCIDGKISISETEIEQKDNVIRDLKAENEDLKSRLSRYENEILIHKNNNNVNTISPEQNLSQTQLNYNKQVITRPGLSQEDQIAAHKEAEQVIKEKLELAGYDCSDWILWEELNVENQKWKSINQIEKMVTNPEGERINLVVKSAKGGHVYLSATDFEFLTSDRSNLLMIWDGENAQSVTADQIFSKESDVNLIFDTEYTPKHYYAALSKVFQYVKRTTFAIKNPSYNASKEVKSFGMDAQTEGVQELFDDNDI